jgi:hypothetical protein
LWKFPTLFPHRPPKQLHRFQSLTESWKEPVIPQRAAVKINEISLQLALARTALRAR